MLIAAIAPTSEDANAFAVGRQDSIHAHTLEVAVEPCLVHADLKGNILNFSPVLSSLFRVSSHVTLHRAQLSHAKKMNFSPVSVFMAAQAITSRFILMSWIGWIKTFHGALANSDPCFSPCVPCCCFDPDESILTAPRLI